jgi:ATP-dependent helicase/nuclease subunit B
MGEAIRPALFTLPFGRNLCDETVSAIFDSVGTQPLALSQALIILPNNRAIRSMNEAFVRRAKPGLLLPQMIAVGDLALDETLGAFLDPLNTSPDILPIIPPMQRLLLLAKLVVQHRASLGNPINQNEALRLARYLAEVIDELEIENVRFGRFEDIDPGFDLAEHWQRSYAQLLAIVPQYYQALEAIQKLGPAQRRNLLLAQLAEAFRQNPPQNLVVAAGISTAAPAIANLLKVVATLPKSMVILPPVDLAMDEARWDQLGPHEPSSDGAKTPPAQETHPQFHLKLLLNNMGFSRAEIDVLGSKNRTVETSITQIFCLADETRKWRGLPVAMKKLPHVRLMTAQDSAEEARAIAVLAREALEIPEQRIAIVTPDREIGLRVAAQLRRWDIMVDDSAGTPLIQSPSGGLIMALLRAAADRFSPVSLLSILKHPLVKFGEERLTWLEKVRVLDLILRGPNSGLGLAATGRRISAWQAEQIEKRREIDENLPQWWNDVVKNLAPLESTVSGDFTGLLYELQMVAGKLTGDVIWKGAAGRQLAAFFEELTGNDLSVIGKAPREAVVSIMTELFDGQAVRPPYGGHPRVAIYGLLEARLQQADLLICAGLNEGSWPQLPQPDPWLAPKIRRELGLAALERNIGLSAHDLATMLGAQQVILSRAKRDRSGPTVASRFLLRISAYLGKALQTDDRAAMLAQLLEKPQKTNRYDKPAPMPSAEQRKIVLSVTDFDRLMADPFAFYANKILRLKTLDPVDAEPSHAWRGSIVHDILERWAKEDKCEPAKLLQRAENLLSNPAVHPALRALWQPRIAAGLKWVAEKMQELAEQGRSLLVAEEPGSTQIAGIKITGRADRIDRLEDGGLAIVDYKTGGAPTDKKVMAGYALQLGLIGLIAESGGIKGVSGEAKKFEYWSLTKDGDKGFGKSSSPVSETQKEKKKLSDEFVVFAETEARKAIEQWITGDAPFTAKLHPEYAPYADYDQLMRYEEWNGREPIDDKIEAKIEDEAAT